MNWIKKQWSSLLVFVVVLALMPVFSHLQSGLNNWLMMQSMTGRFEVPIKIVYFDEQSIASLGGWPLPRNVYAFLAQKLQQAGASMVAFNIYWGQREEGLDENDMLLAEVLQKYENIFGTFYFDELTESNKNENEVTPLILTSKRELEDVLPASGLKSPAAELLQEGQRFGFSNLSVKTDGSVEDAILLLQNGKQLYSSLANVLANSYNPDLELDLAKFKINYRLSTQDLPLISVRDIFRIGRNSELASELKDSIILVDVISLHLGFVKPTPVEPSMPTVAIHAQILDNLLSKNYLKPLPGLFACVALLCVWLVMLFWVGRRAKFSVLPLVLMTSVLIFATIILWQVNFIFPFYAGLAGILFLTGSEMFERHKDQKNKFSKEVTKREKLETDFSATVESLAIMEEESQKNRTRYQKEIIRLRRELTVTPLSKVDDIPGEFPGIVCLPESPLAQVLSELSRIAGTDAPVLISGESGTGKELIAQAIHQKSERARQKFIAVNCGALSESLLESELFGHERGAFTGAQQAKAGFFERANKGTIFLDEISETSQAFQAKLLRVLQEGQYFRVGSTKTRTSDVRVIAASNRYLEELVDQEKFRQDLYFRLNVLPIQLPPLRKRAEDIPLLLTHFFGDEKYQISSEAMLLLKSYSWPGNVRELQNISERIRILGDDVIVKSDWLKQQMSLKMPSQTHREILDDEILQIFRELKFRNDSTSSIARQVGNLHRSTITEYLKGMTFKFFCEQFYQLEQAVRCFNPHPDDELDARVRNRMLKYLRNLRIDLEPNLEIDENLKKLKLRIRKLPQRYHEAALEVAKAYLQGLWEI